jgi:hypothetical protein
VKYNIVCPFFLVFLSCFSLCGLYALVTSSCYGCFSNRLLGIVGFLMLFDEQRHLVGNFRGVRGSFC